MKIIETKDVSDWKYACTCKKCESKLEAEASDLIYIYSAGDGPYPSSESFSVKCPICSESIWVPGDSIHEILKINLRNGYKFPPRTIYRHPFI